jgi:hypothetical protein
MTYDADLFDEHARDDADEKQFRQMNGRIRGRQLIEMKQHDITEEEKEGDVLNLE